MRMPLTLTRLLVSLASWSVSSQLPKTWEEWEQRRRVRMRMPSLLNSSREQQPPLEVNPSQADRLRALLETEGWGLLERHLSRLSQEVSDYYYQAETAEEFHYRKGYLDGHNRTLNYIEVLIGMAEATDEEYIQGEVGKLLEPFRRVTLSRGEEDPEVQERISRVLERAGRAQ